MGDLKALERELHGTAKDKNNGERTGWPASHGPLAELHKLGFIPDPGKRPPWVSWPKVVVLHDRRTQYKASAKVLYADALQALAALSFEGYNIRLGRNGETIELQITKETP